MTPQPRNPPSATIRESGILRPLLWLTLAVGITGNVITASMDTGVLVRTVFGLVALSGASVLVVHHYRHRR